MNLSCIFSAIGKSLSGPLGPARILTSTPLSASQSANGLKYSLADWLSSITARTRSPRPAARFSASATFAERGENIA